ncbi:MAG: TIGR02281 family clan AA aspartic protease [Hyphomicrobiales bacterium]
MEQIVRWTFMLAAFAIVAQLGLDYFVEQKTAHKLAVTEEGESSEFVAKYEDIEDPLPERAVEVDAGRNGHFFIDAKVNGSTIPFLIDTGASAVALSHEAGRDAGLDLSQEDYTVRVNTANGVIAAAPVTLDTIRYETIRLHNIRAFVMPKGALSGHSLLGNSFLSKLREFRIERGKLIMLP